MVKDAMWMCIFFITFISVQQLVYSNPSTLDIETNENSIVATSEAKVNNDGESKIEQYHPPPAFENSMEDDLMANAAEPTVTMAAFKPTDGMDDGEDLMVRSKRQTNTYPSFDDIYDYISKPTLYALKKNTVTNERVDELTALETSNDPENNGDSGGEKHDGGMRGIMGELKASKHHKLTRNDIRQLAKKAVILATLKKLKEKSASSPTAKTAGKSVADVKSVTPSKPNKKHKKAKKPKKKHHIEKHAHKSATPTSTASAAVETPSKENEMAEDLAQVSKKSSYPLTDDDPALKTNDVDLMPATNVGMSKKSSISRIDESVANMFDDSETTSKPIPTERSTLPAGSQLAEKVKSLREFLSKSDASVIPVKFLPDLPSGLRMIGWKEMIEKKKKQLNELEATVGTVEDSSETKPVSLNIDVEDPLSTKTSASELGDMNDFTGDKKSHDPISLQHIGYLNRHIKGARSLRKLIAKTLVGHCKSTGKRIFDAFVAMDKALARAQTIATVIGKKFNIDMDRIDGLVGDKEDQVIETFLRDIFTKIK